MKRNHLTTLIAVVCMLSMAVTALAENVLLDFGTMDTYRGWDAKSPDDNGNYWNPVDSTAYYQNLVDTEGNATTIDMGFVSGFVGGMDSYNGPAGATTVTGPGNASADFSNAVECIAGDISGDQAAVFDYFIDSGFVLNELDPTKVYNLHFFGSKKYDSDDTVTEYGTYTDNEFTTMYESVQLNVHTPGFEWNINTNRTAVITNATKTAGNSIHVYFDSASGGNGYLNTMMIEIVPEPALLGAGVIAVALIARRKLS